MHSRRRSPGLTSCSSPINGDRFVLIEGRRIFDERCNLLKPKGFERETFPGRFEVQSVSEKQRENDFERESSRLNEGLKTCRAVMENYRAMIAGDQPQADNDDSEMRGDVSTTGNAADAYETDSANN